MNATVEGVPVDKLHREIAVLLHGGYGDQLGLGAEIETGKGRGPHRQVVLTIPKRRRIHTRFDRQLLGNLSSCFGRASRRTDDAV
jgi:hypothetical protein